MKIRENKYISRPAIDEPVIEKKVSFAQPNKFDRGTCILSGTLSAQVHRTRERIRAHNVSDGSINRSLPAQAGGKKQKSDNKGQKWIYEYSD
ncbi:MAG TPA: hypothetical protein HPP87_02315 [Planctomycetes bacterium]|nr:hypothetical protein [Planctomycetota bacterium]